MSCSDRNTARKILTLLYFDVHAVYPVICCNILCDASYTGSFHEVFLLLHSFYGKKVETYCIFCFSFAFNHELTAYENGVASKPVSQNVRYSVLFGFDMKPTCNIKH